MKVTITENGILQIDDARLIFRNFAGEAGKFNRGGDRDFSVIIPDQELADMLSEDKNEFGVGWNVKIKPPREEGDEPFMYLKVKVKFNGRGPNIYLKSGNAMNRLDEAGVAILDKIDIAKVDLDIRPYDDVLPSGKAFRAAYLQSMCVTQDIERDRFASRYAN